MNNVTIPLSELFQIGSSKRVLKSEWKDNGIPFYRGREVTRLSIDGFVNNELFISETHYEELAKNHGVPVAGDIIITAIGTIGNSYIVQPTDRFYFKDASVLWMKKKSVINSEFVNLWLKSPLFFEQLDRGNGATVDTLTIKKLQSVKIRLPSLAEQQRIVATLNEACEAIEVARENAKKNSQNSRALFENYLQSVLLNKKWVWKKLGDLCEQVEYGSSAKSQQEGMIPVIRMGNIQNGQLNWDNLVYTSDKEEILKYKLRHNDVLFNRTNSPELVGKTAIYKSERPAIFAGYLIRIHRDEKLLDGDYLSYFLNSKIALDYGRTVVSSSVNQANINGSKLKGYPIPVPSIEEQRNIVVKLDALREETQRLESLYQRKIAALDELKQSLLQQAFRGQL